jgi:putative cell wall-binding protein
MAVAAVAGVTATVGLALASVPAAHATATVTLTNISGPTRYDTSAMIAESKYPTGVPSGHVVLATGVNFPDALAGNYLAGQLSAPILLTPTSTSDPNFQAVVMPALAKLLTGSTKAITVLGGNLAVGDDVVSALQTAGYTVTRIGGATRFDTGQLVDTQTGQTAGNGVSGNKTAIIATGDNFPDALAGGPLAWAKKFPIVLVDGQATTLNSQAAATLTADAIKNVVILGGSNAVNPALNTAITGMGITIDQQFAGTDRTDTAAQLATYEIAKYGFNNTQSILASGGGPNNDKFADALSGGPLGGDPTVIVLILPDQTLGASTTAWYKSVAATMGKIITLGGTFVMPTATGQAAVAAAQSTVAVATNLPQLVSASFVSTTSASQATASNAKGTVVQYVFSQALASATFAFANFKLWAANDDIPAGILGQGICGLSAACAASTNGSAVNVLFDNPTSLESTTGPDSPATISLATVASGAVTLTSGSANPDGAVGIGSSSSTGVQPNVTTAPDLTSVGTPRLAAAANSSAIDLTFDKAAMPTAAPVGYDIMFAAGVSNTTGAGTVANTNKQEASCTGPAGGSASTALTGLTSPGWNPTTNTITIVCANPSGTSAQTITAAQIGWIIIQPLTIQTTAATPVKANWLEASSSPAQQSALPVIRIASLTLTPGTGTNFDLASFTLDAPVNVAGLASGSFGLVTQDAKTIMGGGVCTNTAPVAVPACQVSSGATTTVVNLFFANGTLHGTAGGATAPAVGGSMLAGAATSSNSGPTTTGDDELGAANSATSGQTPGVINAVQLLSAAVTTTTVGLVTTVTGTYTFDFSILGPAAASFHAYDADGTQLDCTTIALGTASADTNAICSAYKQHVGGSPATTTQLSGIKLATVDFGAVTGNNAGAPSKLAPNNSPNPEAQANT